MVTPKARHVQTTRERKQHTVLYVHHEEEKLPKLKTKQNKKMTKKVKTNKQKTTDRPKYFVTVC